MGHESMNEDVGILLNMGIVQPAMLVYQRVSYRVTTFQMENDRVTL